MQAGLKAWLDHWSARPSGALAEIGYGGINMQIYARMVRDVKKKLRWLPRRRLKLLDVGCGNGLMMQKLGAKTQWGVDYSTVLIKSARKRLPKAHFIVCSADSLPFPSHFFDRVLCYGVLLCVPKDCASEVVRECLRVCKKGGRIVIGDVAAPKEFYYGNLVKRIIYPLRPIYHLLTPHKTHVSYYTPSFFNQFKDSARVKILRQRIKGKKTSATRFDVVLEPF